MNEVLEEMAYSHLNESRDYIELVDKLTKSHTHNLDNIVGEIHNLLRNGEYDIDISVLQYYYAKLSTELYMMVDKLKEFEIYASFAKSTQSESYNKAYLEESVAYDKKPSATELQIRADVKSQKESVVTTVYNSAFKTIKSKVEAGSSVADTLKNIIKTKNSVDYSTNQVDNLNRY